MLRATFVILGVAVDAFGIALAGCGTSPVATQPIEDSAVVDAQGTADGPRDAEMDATASDSGPGVCGCALAPVCGESCHGPCGCCGCMAGDVRMVGSDVLVCNETMGCYQPLTSSDAAVPDAADSSASFGADADAGFACGAETCTAAQACVYSYGGTPANCSPTNDAGGCPVGFMYSASCPNLANRPGCNAPTPPPTPVGCIGIPASCGVTPTCACFPTTACPGGSHSCQSVTAHSVICGGQ
jgi:hypothetical protein